MRVREQTGRPTARGRRALIGASSALVGVAAAGGILLGVLAGASWLPALFPDHRAPWLLDRLADLRPVWLVLGAAAVAGLALARWWRSALVLAVPVLLAAWSVAPLWVHRPAPPTDGGGRLRVATLNFTLANDGVDELAAHLRDEQPADVVVIVESSPRIDRRFRVGDTGYEVVFPRPGEPNMETTVLARVPVTVRDRLLLQPDHWRAAADLEVELDGRPVRILGAHTLSPRGAWRSAARDQEIAEIGRWVASQPGPVVVAGDLNVTRWSPAFATFSEAGLVDSSLGHGYQPTWTSRRTPLALPIDHVLHSHELTTEHREVGPSFGSVHRMVVATLAFARP